MASWLIAVIEASVFVLLLVALGGAIVIVASNRNNKLRKRVLELQKDNTHKQQLLDAYGIKEINIERESDY